MELIVLQHGSAMGGEEACVVSRHGYCIRRVDVDCTTRILPTCVYEYYNTPELSRVLWVNTCAVVSLATSTCT